MARGRSIALSLRARAQFSNAGMYIPLIGESSLSLRRKLQRNADKPLRASPERSKRATEDAADQSGRPAKNLS